MSIRVEHPGILILAAGQSKRLGTPKQLLEFEGELLINRLIRIVKSIGTYPITLVLGAHFELIQSKITQKEISVVLNPQWEEGMASSIRKGVFSMMQHHAALDGIVILVCDQPYLSKEHVLSLLNLQHATGKSIVACSYGGVVGTPVLFHKNIFNSLLDLKGDVGAKKIIQDNQSDLATLQFEEGGLDIDTEEAYLELKKQSKKNDN